MIPMLLESKKKLDTVASQDHHGDVGDDRCDHGADGSSGDTAVQDSGTRSGFDQHTSSPEASVKHQGGGGFESNWPENRISDTFFYQFNVKLITMMCNICSFLYFSGYLRILDNVRTGRRRLSSEVRLTCGRSVKAII